MSSKTKFESQSLTIEVSPSLDETGATLQINCPSDGSSQMWMEGEEASRQAKQGWLCKLGCLLKIHGNIKCQCSQCSTKNTATLPPHTDTFNNPWHYRLSDFPNGYKLFAVARPATDDNHQRKDYYLCGMFYCFLHVLPD
jgi:hypothetical protein